MPRYFFDVRNNDVLSADQEGFELANIEAARVEASLSLLEVTKHTIRDRREDGGEHRMAIEVRDDAGPVLQAKFSIEHEPNN